MPDTNADIAKRAYEVAEHVFRAIQANREGVGA
jgi:hypothetical protein